mmetsp:Transcript_30490/g.70269  ORF Transcript_30490/g.70269 Transcript_30490/m.70269 type:complete len:329 (+) Transcript_30490:1986-2972(+)
MGMFQRCQNGDLIVNRRVIRWGQILAQHALDGHFFAGCAMRPTADCRKRTRLEPGVQLIHITKGRSLASLRKVRKFTLDHGLADLQGHIIKGGFGFLVGRIMFVFAPGDKRRLYDILIPTSCFRTCAAHDTQVVRVRSQTRVKLKGPPASLRCKLYIHQVLVSLLWIYQQFQGRLERIHNRLQFHTIIHVVAVDDTDPQILGGCPIRSVHRGFGVLWWTGVLIRIQQRRSKAIATLLQLGCHVQFGRARGRSWCRHGVGFYCLIRSTSSVVCPSKGPKRVPHNVVVSKRDLEQTERKREGGTVERWAGVGVSTDYPMPKQRPSGVFLN